LERKAASKITLTLMLLGILTLAINIQPAFSESLKVSEAASWTEELTRLVLETDKQVYVLGENVTLILKNIGADTVQIGGYPAWQIFTYPGGEMVYPAVFAFLAWSLDPEESDIFTWNQYNQFNGSFCEPGTYVVRDTQGLGLSAYFKIISAQIVVPDDYSTIQEAVNAANPEDTIYVRNGTYFESVVINKRVWLIGESKTNTTIINGAAFYDFEKVVSVTADNVKICGFKVCGADTGIFVSSANNITISDCIITGNWVGLALADSRGNLIVRNWIDKNLGAGISLWSSRSNTIIENTISNTTERRSSIGIAAFQSNNSVIYHNNFINNIWDLGRYQASFNDWDDGYPSGGNYWSNYAGVDFYGGLYQNETGSDGIGDTPYVVPSIDTSNRDRYPLMNPWTPDTTPPVTTITLSGVLGDNDWFTSDVTVTLSATDNTEVDKTEYSFDKATWTTYTAPFKISIEGKTMVSYKSTDKAYNTETAQTKTIRIDKTPPSGSIKINDDIAYINLTSVTLTLSANDATSGVAKMRFSNDNITWSNWEAYSTSKAWALTAEDGAKTIYVQYKDNAGLTSPAMQDTITSDATRPSASAGQNQTVIVGETMTFNAEGFDNLGIVN